MTDAEKIEAIRKWCDDMDKECDTYNDTKSPFLRGAVGALRTASEGVRAIIEGAADAK